MKNGCLIVWMGFFFGFVCTAETVGEKRIFKNGLPKARSEVLTRYESAVAEDVIVDSDLKRNGMGNYQRSKRKPPKARAQYAPGEIIVKFKPGVSKEVVANTNSRHGVSTIYTSPFAGFMRLRIPGGKTPPGMLEVYRRNPNVEYAELNYVAHTCWVPDDPLYSLQWHLDNPDYGGIQIEDAWEFFGAPGAPGDGAIVAVVDTGVAYEDYPAPDHWHIDTYNAYGGSGNSWWCGMFNANWPKSPGYGNGWKDYLQHSFDLTSATGTVTFSFQHRYDLESGWDYAYIEVSSDGGNNWTTLETYTGFSRSNRTNHWKAKSIDLTSYAGSSVLIRFRVYSDEIYSDEDGGFDSGGAFFIDEIELEDGSGIIFYDNVESGAGDWETTQYEQAPDLAGTSFVNGYDFVNNDDHPNDDDGHGTHVTGTVAQSTNNGAGVAGVAFNCSVMPVKVLGSDGSGYYSWIADGIIWATDNGADVINLSLSGSDPSTTLENAVAYAYNAGVTIVCAAGNQYEEGNPPAYPAAYDAYCIAVGATRYDETRAYYSNTGSYLDVVAPGGDVTVDQNADTYADGVLQNTFSDTPVDWGYWFYQGTSMAAPHVSGLAALLIANGSATTPDEVRGVLEDTAEDLGDPGRDDIYGYGLVDAYAALMINAPLELLHLQDWESGPAGWFSKYDLTIGPGYDSILIVDDPVPPSGEWSQKVVRVDGASNYLSPLIAVTPGERYIVCAWINWVSGGWPFVGISRYNQSGSPMGLPLSNEPGTAPRLIWLIGKGDYHTREGYYPIGDWVTSVPIVDEWNWYEKIFTAPEGTTYVRITTELFKGASRGGDPLAYFDDITMYYIPWPQ